MAEIELCAIEIEVMKILNGEDMPGWVWGAAMLECCEHIASIGFAVAGQHWELTKKGKEYLAQWRLLHPQTI